MQDQSDAAVARTGIVIVGCGFVADFYGATLALHPELHLVGATDHDSARTERFVMLYGGEPFSSLEKAVGDPRVNVVVNLTNPGSHFAVSRASLEAGKHVYSEKPLAMVLSEAEELVALANRKQLLLSSAPCSLLGRTASVLKEALRRDEIGRVRLVYAELDDGPIHQMHPEEWESPSGTPWPWRDEFAVGCTMEHAGYHLTWLVDLFGPARSVSAFSTCLVPDKPPDLSVEICAPDFSVACIQFESGVVARLTCSIVAPHNHSLRIIGDRGTLSVDECWHFGAPVRIRRFSALSLRADSYTWLARHWLTRLLYGLDGKQHPLSHGGGWRSHIRRHEMDYALGISEMACALREGRTSRLPAALALHVNEIALAIQNSREAGAPVSIRSTMTKTYNSASNGANSFDFH
jgi:predicted dehydrogenase